MNPTQTTRLAVALAAISAAVMSAQTVPANAGGTTNPEGETIRLSPFIVNAQNDVGFVAASALAGGRLNTDLKDTPVAYSVLTKEFLEAFNVTDLTQAMDWSVNTTYNPGNNQDQGYGFSSAINITFRGAAPGETNYPMRNFFPFNYNSDSYALDRFDFARGPNAILFGAAQFGGTPISVTKKALTTKTIDELQVQIGSWNKYRATFDVNQPIGGKAAVRVAGMWEDGDTYRDYEWRKKKGVFVSGTYNLTERTSIRAEGEYAEGAQKIFPTNLLDQVSAWDGKTTFSGSVLPANAPSAAQRAAAGVTYGASNANPLFAPLWVVDPTAFGTGNVLNFANFFRTQGAAGNNNSSLTNYIGGKPIRSGSVSYASQPMLDGYDVPSDRYMMDLLGASAFRIPSRSTTNLWSGGKPTQSHLAKDFALTLDHQIGNSWFFEVAGDANRVKINGDSAVNRGVTTEYIDISQTLPNGTANPNYLQPYTEFWNYQNTRTYSLSAVRASVAYIKDTRFGKLQFAVGAGANYQRQQLRGYLYLLPLQSIGPDARYWDAAQNNTALWYRLYLNQGGRNFYNTNLGPLTLVNPDGTTTTATPHYVLDASRKDNNADNITKFRHVMAAGNLSLFKERLVLIGAVRRDLTQLETRNTLNPGDYPAGWDGSNVIFRPNAPADWATLTYMPKDASGNVTGAAQPADTRPRLSVPATATVAGSSILAAPQYASDRFRDDYNPPILVVGANTFSLGATFNATKWLGIYGNLATSFNPNLLVQRINGTLMPPSVSRGTDAGIRLSPLEGRMSINLGYFTSFQNNSPIGTAGSVLGDFNAIYAAPVIGDLTPGSSNHRNETPIPRVARDTQTQNSKGFEIEVIANITKSWRLLFNLAHTIGTRSNIQPDSRGYIASHLTVAKQILSDAGVVFDANNIGSIDPALNDPTLINVGAVTNAVNGWNDLQRNTIPNLVTGTQKLVGATDYTANLGTDYTFQGGKLKGFSSGIGVHYRGKVILGFRGSDTIVDPSNPTRAIDDPTVDAYTPVYSKPYTTVDARFGYSFRMAERHMVTVSLNIQNLLNNRTPVYFLDVPGGQASNVALRPRNGDVTSPAVHTVPGSFYYRAPINWTLTASVDF